MFSIVASVVYVEFLQAFPLHFTNASCLADKRFSNLFAKPYSNKILITKEILFFVENTIHLLIFSLKTLFSRLTNKSNCKFCFCVLIIKCDMGGAFSPANCMNRGTSNHAIGVYCDIVLYALH